MNYDKVEDEERTSRGKPARFPPTRVVWKRVNRVSEESEEEAVEREEKEKNERSQPQIHRSAIKIFLHL